MSAGTPARGVSAGACAVSGHLDTRTAAMEVAHELHDALVGPCDLLVIFASFHHCAALPEAVDAIRATIDPATTLAVTAEAVLGHSVELDGVAGMTAVALRLPGVRLTPWASTPEAPFPLRDPDAIAARIGFDETFRAALFLGEPFSTPITRLLPAIGSCGRGRPVPIVGGMASGASQPGHNVLMVDEEVVSAGAIGVSLSGDVAVDFIVSQGCRPVGQPLVVTRAKGHVLLELGGRPALDVLQDLTSSMSDEERELLLRGVLIGTVIDERRRPFGRGDFLVRNMIGLDREREAIAVGDTPRVGQTVQFHVRDAVTAAEDLQLLLDAQVMQDPPFGAMLFTCNGRGKRLFGTPDHDITIINQRLGGVPIAGFFAAGEIGPIGDRSFLHGHTASLVLFRAS